MNEPPQNDHPHAWDGGVWIETASGKQFHPLDPQPDEIDIEDIAHALSHLCRFTGHISEFWSVAQHSLLVDDLLVEHLGEPVEPILIGMRLTALLHDASEAYLNDIAAPIKKLIPDYIEIEQKVTDAVVDKFNIIYPYPKVVKEMDTLALCVEAKHLLPSKGVVWGGDVAYIAGDRQLPFYSGIAWTPLRVRRLFTDRVKTLLDRQSNNSQ